MPQPSDGQDSGCRPARNRSRFDFCVRLCNQHDVRIRCTSAIQAAIWVSPRLAYVQLVVDSVRERQVAAGAYNQRQFQLASPSARVHMESFQIQRFGNICQGCYTPTHAACSKRREPYAIRRSRASVLVFRDGDTLCWLGAAFPPKPSRPLLRIVHWTRVLRCAVLCFARAALGWVGLGGVMCHVRVERVCVCAQPCLSRPLFLYRELSACGRSRQPKRVARASCLPPIGERSHNFDVLYVRWPKNLSRPQVATTLHHVAAPCV